MLENLITHFEKYIEIPTQDNQEILNFFEAISYNKKENLLDLHSKCKFHYFVIKGCLRMFFIDDKGVEHTIQFAIENWWLTDYLAFEQQTNTEFIIQALEPTEVLQIDHAKQEKLFQKFPQLERYFRLIYQRVYASLQLRTKFQYDLSREEFYRNFHDSFPAFTKRIPQHLLASYLNMTPEYLSEIKKNLRS